MSTYYVVKKGHATGRCKRRGEMLARIDGFEGAWVKKCKGKKAADAFQGDTEQQELTIENIDVSQSLEPSQVTHEDEEELKQSDTEELQQRMEALVIDEKHRCHVCGKNAVALCLKHKFPVCAACLLAVGH